MRTRVEEMGDLQWTSRYTYWLSWPMELLAMQRYRPAYVNWTFFKVREETRAWLRTTMFLSKLYKEEKENIDIYAVSLCPSAC